MGKSPEKIIGEVLRELGMGATSNPQDACGAKTPHDDEEPKEGERGEKAKHMKQRTWMTRKQERATGMTQTPWEYQAQKEPGNAEWGATRKKTKLGKEKQIRRPKSK